MPRSFIDTSNSSLVELQSLLVLIDKLKRVEQQRSCAHLMEGREFLLGGGNVYRITQQALRGQR